MIAVLSLRGDFLLQTPSTSYATVMTPPHYAYFLTSRHKIHDKLDIFISTIPNNLHTQNI